MITYNDIYEAARKERYSDPLQALSKNFIEDVSEYLKDKKEIAGKDDDEFSDVIVKTKKQLENAITLFKELMLRRRKKILNLVLIATETGISKQDFENMLGFEKDLFEGLMKCVEESDTRLDCALNGKSGDTKNLLISFSEKVEEFFNLEGEKMGPYEAGQVVNLPKEIAKILVEDGKAEIIE